MRKQKRMMIINVLLIGTLLLASCSSGVAEETVQEDTVAAETEEPGVAVTGEPYYQDEEIIAGWSTSDLLTDTIMMSSIDDDDGMTILVPQYVEIVATIPDAYMGEDYDEEGMKWVIDPDTGENNEDDYRVIEKFGGSSLLYFDTPGFYDIRVYETDEIIYHRSVEVYSLVDCYDRVLDYAYDLIGSEEMNALEEFILNEGIDVEIDEDDEIVAAELGIDIEDGGLILFQDIILVSLEAAINEVINIENELTREGIGVLASASETSSSDEESENLVSLFDVALNYIFRILIVDVESAEFLSIKEALNKLYKQVSALYNQVYGIEKIPRVNEYETYSVYIDEKNPLTEFNSNNLSKDTETYYPGIKNVKISIKSLPKNSILSIGTIETKVTLVVSSLPKGTANIIFNNKGTIFLNNGGLGNSGSLIIANNEGKIYVTGNEGFVTILNNKGEIHVSDNDNFIRINKIEANGKLIVSSTGVRKMTQMIIVENNLGTIESGQTTNNNTALTAGNGDTLYITSNDGDIKIFANNGIICVENNRKTVEIGANTDNLKGDNKGRVFVKNKVNGTVILTNPGPGISTIIDDK